jgi:hypothetical protein
MFYDVDGRMVMFRDWRKIWKETVVVSKNGQFHHLLAITEDNHE